MSSAVIALAYVGALVSAIGIGWIIGGLFIKD